ncbi:hypothetical protein MMC27_000364 [Xylographa pallens]|nr:hypothetical protein [Xylographa pallens]
MRFTAAIILSIVAASTSVFARYHDDRGIYARAADPYAVEELDLYARDLYEGDLYERDFFEQDLGAKSIYARDASPEESHDLFRRTTVKQLADQMQAKQGEINLAHTHMISSANLEVMQRARADFQRKTAEFKAIQAQYNAAVAAATQQMGRSRSGSH